MRNKRIISTISILMILCFILSGCGKTISALENTQEKTNEQKQETSVKDTQQQSTGTVEKKQETKKEEKKELTDKEKALVAIENYLKALKTDDKKAFYEIFKKNITSFRFINEDIKYKGKFYINTDGNLEADPSYLGTINPKTYNFEDFKKLYSDILNKDFKEIPVMDKHMFSSLFDDNIYNTHGSSYGSMCTQICSDDNGGLVQGIIYGDKGEVALCIGTKTEKDGTNALFTIFVKGYEGMYYPLHIIKLKNFT